MIFVKIVNVSEPPLANGDVKLVISVELSGNNPIGTRLHRKINRPAKGSRSGSEKDRYLSRFVVRRGNIKITVSVPIPERNLIGPNPVG